MSSTSAGWQPDPTGRHEHRYWDGTGWTDNVADGGVGSNDPMTVSAGDPTIAQPGIGDPTATQPTIGDPTTPEASAPPTAWPPASMPPPAPVGPVGSDGSRRNLWIGAGVLGAVAIAVIAFLVLGGDDDDSGQQAADVAEDADAGDEPDASSGDEGDASTDDAEGLDDSFGDLGDDLPEFDPEDAEAYLAAIYKDMFGLSDEQAECLASEVAPLMDTTDPSFTPDVSEMLDMFERCDIDPSDLGGFSDG